MTRARRALAGAALLAGWALGGRACAPTGAAYRDYYREQARLAAQAGEQATARAYARQAARAGAR